MKILVTGGAGYIGSHMARMLLSRGYEPIVLDTLEFGHRQALPSPVRLVVGNVGDRRVVDEIFRDHVIEGVMHFAGYLQVEESVREPIKYMKNNVLSPIVLLEAMRKAHVGRIIFSSSAAVYGNPVAVPIPEEHQKEPVSPYGLSKWAFEELLRVYDRSFGMKSISLRYFNAAGASLDGNNGEVHEPETHLIPLACRAALRSAQGKPHEFAIYGIDYPTPDGTALRDFIHIEDLCEAHMLTLEALGNGHDSAVYNVGTGEGVSVKEVVRQVRKAAGTDFPAHEVGRRAGDPAILVSDPERIKKELGWKPKYSDIGTIVDTALQWHKSHPKGYV
jgi:UDP-glucose 4-epimerase